MNDALKNIIDRINKLKSLSKNNSNANEAAAAARAAAKLIDQYQLEEADLQIKSEKGEDEILVDENPLFSSGRIMEWHRQLAYVLCKHFGCSGYTWNVGRGRVAGPHISFRIVGRKQDTEIIHYFYNWLQPLISKMMRLHAYGRGMNYSQVYALGVVEGIRIQLEAEREEMKRRAQDENRVQAMVLLDNRYELARKVMYEDSRIKPRRAYTSLRNDSDALNRGVEDGKNIHLTKGMNNSNDNTKYMK